MSSTPKSIPFSSRRNLSLSLAAAVALVLGSQGGHAQTLTWSGTSEPGIWNTTNTNWLNSGTPTVWNNNSLTSATFDGTAAAGTVTLGENITVKNLTFNAPGYIIEGGGHTLILSNTTMNGSADATINADLAGTGLTITNTKTGSTRTVTLSGNNTYTGTTTISGSGGAAGNQILRLDSVNALGSSEQINVGSGSSLQLGLNDAVFGRDKTISITGYGAGNVGGLQAAAGVTATWAGTIKLNTNTDGARVGTQAGGTLILSGPIQNGSTNSLAISALVSESKTGGVVIISGTQNTYTGITNIIRGTLKLGAHNALPTGTTLDTDSTAVADETTFDLNGFNQTVGALTRSHSTGGGGSFITNTGTSLATLAVNQSSDTTYNGIIKDGGASGVLALTKSNTGTLTLTAKNTYTGTTTVNGGTLQLSGTAGALASNNFQLNGGSLLIDNSVNNNINRLTGAANLTLNGGTFEYRGSTGGSTETFGKITVSQGFSKITIAHGSGSSAVLTSNQPLTRATNGSIALINGANLGATGSTNAARLMLTTAPALIGGDGSLGTNHGIVPYLLGEVDSAGVGTATGTPNTFITYDTTTGLRPLRHSEFESSFVTDANVRITSTPSSNVAPNTINSLIVDGASIPLNLSGTLTNRSGAFLFSGPTSTTTHSVREGALALNGAEAIIMINTATASIGSKITGANGLSFFGTGTLGLGSSESDYTGETMLYGNLIVPQTSSQGSGDTLTGPFGRSTVVFAGSNLRTSNASTSAPIIGNAVRFQADMTFFSSGHGLTFSGPATLEGNRTLTNNSGRNLAFTGGISGDGLTVAGNSPVILGGTNTYSGSTLVRSGKLDVSGSIADSSAIAVQNSGSFLLSGNHPSDFNRIGDNTPVTLGGGSGSSATFAIDNSTADARFEETVGTLTLLSNAILDFGTGDLGTYLHFADSSNTTWNGTLSIYNWSGGTTDRLFFGTTQNGLSAAQLSKIVFYSDNGNNWVGHGFILTDGELVPVPEPSTILGGVALLGLIGWRERRRFFRRAAVEG